MIALAIDDGSLPVGGSTGMKTPATYDEVVERIWCRKGINSTNRLCHMLTALKKVDSPTFWQVFQEVWSTCDDTWLLRDLVRAELTRHQPVAPYLTPDNNRFYDTLPDLVTVYRGCSRRRARGISWTVDRTIAAGFAQGHRFIGVPNPVIVEAVVHKSQILAVDMSRNEHEVLVDWDHLSTPLKRVRYVPQPYTLPQA